MQLGEHFTIIQLHPFLHSNMNCTSENLKHPLFWTPISRSQGALRGPCRLLARHYAI